MPKIEINGQDFECESHTAKVAMWYPSVGDEVNALEIEVNDGADIDNIKVRFDFERSGWVVETQDDDAQWHESAFIGVDL